MVSCVTTPHAGQVSFASSFSPSGLPALPRGWTAKTRPSTQRGTLVRHCMQVQYAFSVGGPSANVSQTWLRQPGHVAGMENGFGLRMPFVAYQTPGRA